jgi:hypothetical protein
MALSPVVLINFSGDHTCTSTTTEHMHMPNGYVQLESQ